MASRRAAGKVQMNIAVWEDDRKLIHRAAALKDMTVTDYVVWRASEDVKRDMLKRGRPAVQVLPR